MPRITVRLLSYIVKEALQPIMAIPALSHLPLKHLFRLVNLCSQTAQTGQTLSRRYMERVLLFRRDTKTLVNSPLFKVEYSEDDKQRAIDLALHALTPSETSSSIPQRHAPLGGLLYPSKKRCGAFSNAVPVLSVLCRVK